MVHGPADAVWGQPAHRRRLRVRKGRQAPAAVLAGARRDGAFQVTAYATTDFISDRAQAVADHVRAHHADRRGDADPPTESSTERPPA